MAWFEVVSSDENKNEYPDGNVRREFNLLSWTAMKVW
jgi:hypothetical protein